MKEIGKQDIQIWEYCQRKKYFLGKLSKEEIEKLEMIPGWKWVAVDSVVENKKLLLNMAKNGDPKPIKNKHYLANVLGFYTNIKNKCYDVEFDGKIRNLAPQWFANTVDDNKNKLIQMARNGEPRPAGRKHYLAAVLGSYICKKHPMYDKYFLQEITNIAPSWFVNTADQNKKKLLDMARMGSSRPKKRDLSLSSYILESSDCFDPVFNKEIRDLAPHWFFDVVLDKKNKLLEMAKNGEHRPNQKHPLGRVLCFYTNPNNECFDSEFTKEIKRISPNWFVKTSIGNKEKLLEMAKNGEPRPDQRKNSLGKHLCNYLSSASFDPIFNEQIRKLAPHWFKKD